MKRLVLTVALLAALAAGCSQRPATDAETKAVEATMDNFRQALEGQDLEAFSLLVSHDPNMVYFGFSPGERWAGYEALETAMRDLMDRYDNLHLIPHDQQVTIGPSGDVAWCSELLDWNMMVGGNEVNLKDTRFTGVLEKDNGAWKFVQFHFSEAVPDSLLTGQP